MARFRVLYALALIATPAFAGTYGPVLPEAAGRAEVSENLPKQGLDLEYVWQGLNAIDAVETCVFLRSGRAQEANPLLGRHPSCGKVVAFKAGAGVLHYLIADSLDPEARRIFEIVSIAVQGGIVAWNAQFVF